MSPRSQLFTALGDGLGAEVVYDDAGVVIAMGVFCRDRLGGDCVMTGHRDSEGNFALTRGAAVAAGPWPQPPASRVVVGRARWTPAIDTVGAALHLFDLRPELGPQVSPLPPAINLSIPMYAVTV